MVVCRNKKERDEEKEPGHKCHHHSQTSRVEPNTEVGKEGRREGERKGGERKRMREYIILTLKKH